MENPNNFHLPEPNPYTRDKHQRQVFWQVLVPIVLSVIVILVMAGLVTLASGAQIIRLSDISIIFLILPTAVVGLLFLALIVGLIYLLAKVIKLLPPYSRLAQIYLDRISAALKKAADSAANPIVMIESMVAGLRAVFQKPGSNGAASAEQTRTTR